MNLQSASRTGLEIFTTRLADIFALPDPEAAPALNQRMVVLDQVHRIHELTYPEIGIISREMERRHLYKHLIDPDTDEPFPSFTAWASCSNFIACRRIIFESKRDLELLADVPSEKLISVSKSNIKVLTQLSTAVRNDPAILAAAKSDNLMEKVEKEFPDQHLEVRKPLRLNPGRSDAKVIEKWFAYAQEHDIAGSLTEAIVKACEIAIHEAELDEELKGMPLDQLDACRDEASRRLLLGKESMKPHVTRIRGYWWRVELPGGVRFIAFGFKLACQLAAGRCD